MGYKIATDDNGTFANRTTDLVSPLLQERIFPKYMKELWQVMLALGQHGWAMFGAYTRALMARGEAVQLEARSCVADNVLTVANQHMLLWEDATIWSRCLIYS